MTSPTSPARRRADAGFALLTHTVTPLQRAIDDAQSDADARAEKTRRLRSARLERERHSHAPASSAPKGAKPAPEGIT